MVGLVGIRRWASYRLGTMILPATRKPPSVRLQEISPRMVHTEPSYTSGVGLTWDHFLEGGSNGISYAVVQEDGKRVKLTWADGHKSDFSLQWLRDHSAEAINDVTKNRKLDTYSVQNRTRLKYALVEALPSTPPSALAPHGDTHDGSNQVLQLGWDADQTNEELTCTVPVDYLRQHCTSPTARDLRQRFGTSIDVANPNNDEILWDSGVFSTANGNSPPIVDFKDIVEDQSPPSSAPRLSCPKAARAHLIGLIRSHGIALVRGVPADDAEKLALKVAGFMRATMYGAGMWTIASKPDEGGQQYNDVAYTCEALALHTDIAYVVDPPGFQLFMCDIKAPEGGTSIYIDGFAVAERLRVENPESFDFLTRTPITNHCFDAGIHYVAEGPIFRLGPLGRVDQVRYNEYDRAPLDYLSNDDIDRFYEHHSALCAILRDPSMVVRILLEPGDAIIFNNQRALHGRESYKGWRRMRGCFLGMDEVKSTARLYGY